MSGIKTIMVVGSAPKIKAYTSMLQTQGVNVVVGEDFGTVLANIVKIRPSAIAIILPQYWEKASTFVAALRQKEGFSRTPIIYIGGMIEGADQAVLSQYGVRCVTLGPVTTNEVVRLIISEANKRSI